MNRVSIIGTGPAGLTAAIYTARAGLKPVIYAGLQHGGQLTTTTDVENFPGFVEGIMGPKLMSDMTAQAERVGATIKYETVVKTDFSGKVHKFWTDGSDEAIESEAIIISTGATAKTLGLSGEKELMGRGLSTCATCDGFFYKGKEVIVTGGGDSAMEEALYLANLCKKVLLVHRRDVFRASKIMLDRAKKHPNIEFMLPYRIQKLHGGSKGLEKVSLENTENGSTQDITVDGLFYAIGHKPNSEVFLPWVEVDELGYIEIENYTCTKTKGVFAAGDIADHTFRQAITAAGMGCQAAMQAARYLEEKESN